MPENAFTHLVGTLSRGGRAMPIPGITPRPETGEPSKTERLRQLIQERGPISPLSLAVELDLEGGSGLVRALLKVDFDRGSVIARDGKYIWNPAYDNQLEQQLRAAARLLRRHGYRIKRPNRQTTFKHPKGATHEN